MARQKKRPAVPGDDVLLGTAWVAAALGLSERQVREHAEAGRLKGQKLNARTWVFRVADFEAFVPRPRGRPKKKPAAEPGPDAPVGKPRPAAEPARARQQGKRRGRRG